MSCCEICSLLLNVKWGPGSRNSSAPAETAGERSTWSPSTPQDDGFALELTFSPALCSGLSSSAFYTPATLTVSITGKKPHNLQGHKLCIYPSSCGGMTPVTSGHLCTPEESDQMGSSLRLGPTCPVSGEEPRTQVGI